MFCWPLGQDFTIHYVWPWLKDFTGSLSPTFSCQTWFLKVLQNFIDSGQESKTGKWNRPLQSVTLHWFWWDQGGFCGKMQELQLCHHFSAHHRIVPRVGPQPARPLLTSRLPLVLRWGLKVEGERARWTEGWCHIGLMSHYGSGLISSGSGLLIKQDYYSKRFHKYIEERLGFLGGMIHEPSGVKLQAARVLIRASESCRLLESIGPDWMSHSYWWLCIPAPGPKQDLQKKTHNSVICTIQLKLSGGTCAMHITVA